MRRMTPSTVVTRELVAWALRKPAVIRAVGDPFLDRHRTLTRLPPRARKSSPRVVVREGPQGSYDR